MLKTVAGNISIDANDSIQLGGSELNAGKTGIVDLSAGLDGVVDDDLSQIEFSGGASVHAGLGMVQLDTTDGGDILLGNITTTNSGTAISINSGQDVLDNTEDEGNLLSAINGTIQIEADGNVGVLKAPDFFKATADDHELLEVQAKAINITAGQDVGIKETSATNTDFTIDAQNVFVYSRGPLTFLDNSSGIEELTLVSEQSVILPDVISVTDHLRIDAGDDVQASDGTIDIVVPSLLFHSGSAQTLRTSVDQLDITTNGDLDVTNSGALELIDLDCDLIAVHNLAGTGNISVMTPSDLLISDDVIAGPLDGTVSSGQIELVAFDIDVNDVVLSGNGNININADSIVTMNDMGVVSTVAGAVLVRADQIEMQDGSRIIAGRDSSSAYDPSAPNIMLGAGIGGGNADIQATNDISLASVQTNNDTVNAIKIVSVNGQVKDGGDTDVDIISESPNALVTIESALGIGDGNPIESLVSRLDASSLLTGDIELSEGTDIELLDVDTVDGAIQIIAAGDIQAIDVATGETEAVEDNADNLNLVSTGGSIFASRMFSVDDILLTANSGSIQDEPGGFTEATANGTFMAQDLIDIANSTTNRITVGEVATFEADQVRIGQDSMPAGDAAAQNVFFGSLQISADGAIVTEDDSMLLTGTSQVASNMALASGDNIENTSGARILSELAQVQLNALNHVFLGNQANDEVRFGSLGIVTIDVHLELEAGVELVGDAPDQDPAVFGTDDSFGTEVDQTLYMESAGEIIQATGDLHVRNLALAAQDYVHLASVKDFNELIAISAITPGALTDPTLIAQLEALGNVENSEVDSSLPQSIAWLHQGTADINMVASPTGIGVVDGLVSSDGSMFASAVDAIMINRDVVATSISGDPQVTVYVANGTTTNPGIVFNQTEIRVDGTQNLGIVNQPFTTATFFDAQGFVFRGTTEFLVLNPDGSADQNIVLEYANPGEAGYRVGVVWDNQNQPGNPVENPNTFVANVNDASEAYNDAIYVDNPTTIHPLGGNEGSGQETIPKIAEYSKDAIIAHQFDPKVFSEVTVRHLFRIQFVG